MAPKNFVGEHCNRAKLSDICNIYMLTKPWFIFANWTIEPLSISLMNKQRSFSCLSKTLSLLLLLLQQLLLLMIHGNLLGKKMFIKLNENKINMQFQFKIDFCFCFKWKSTFKKKNLFTSKQTVLKYFSILFASLVHSMGTWSFKKQLKTRNMP